MGCDFWMDAQREAPERLGKANERIKQLEAELAEAKRRAAWYESQMRSRGCCYWCIHIDIHIEEEPCKSCYTKDFPNLTILPVPDDFEVKNG